MRLAALATTLVVIAVVLSTLHYGDASARALGATLADRTAAGAEPEWEAPRKRTPMTVSFEHRA